jgi:hypothetical protein
MLAVGRQSLVESAKWNASKMSVGRSIAPDLADVFELWSSPADQRPDDDPAIRR